MNGGLHSRHPKAAIKQRKSMDRKVDIERAAHIFGVSEEEIDGLVASGELPFSEGHIKIDDLCKHYPETRINAHNMVDIVSQIREDSARKALDAKFGRTKDLAGDLEKTERALRYFKARSDCYYSLLVNLKAQLTDIEAKVECKQRIHAITQWIEHNLHDSR